MSVLLLRPSLYDGVDHDVGDVADDIINADVDLDPVDCDVLVRDVAMTSSSDDDDVIIR